jgi:hypothetical protein
MPRKKQEDLAAYRARAILRGEELTHLIADGNQVCTLCGKPLCNYALDWYGYGATESLAAVLADMRRIYAGGWRLVPCSPGYLNNGPPTKT